MGQPVYGREDVPLAEIKPTEEEFLRLAKRGSIDERLDDLVHILNLSEKPLIDLPGTGREVDAIGAILHSTQFIFKKEQATEDRLKEYARRGKLKEFQYLHFAAHGLVPDMAPGLASIALSQDQDETEDGFLTAGEVYGLDLACDCVVLSACKLGLGQSVRGEGVMGLTRAFMYAGSRSVVVSLWSVADEATLVLMQHFYTNLEKGAAKDEALRQARLTLMQEGFTGPSGTSIDASHPFFWAPFVIYGDAH